MKINLDFIYPIGSLYLTTNTISPSVLFGGTWERISDDAYLKIATGSTAGNLDGTSSQHKIPVSSMPAHSHNFHGVNDGAAVQQQQGHYPIRIYQDKKSNWSPGHDIDNTGGGQPYYPYYYDVFVWKRIA